MATRISAEFTLTGSSFDPDEVTNFLGVQPTKTWRLGDRINQKTIVRYKHDGWKFSTGYKKLDEKHGINLGSLARSIFDRLQPHTSKLREACEKFKLEAELCCVMYIEGDAQPGFLLDRDVVRWAAELNADLDFDLYVLSREKRHKRRVKVGRHRKA